MHRWMWILACLCVCACAGRKAEPATTPPPLLIDQRGTAMPLESAITHVSFRPFLPATSQVLAYAVLPPLGGPDTDANRGLGIEYEAGNNAMLLSEWPKQQFTIAFKRGEIALSNCTPTHYSAQALAWTTPSHVVVTLQPDGPVAAAQVEAEARRLIRAGACR